MSSGAVAAIVVPIVVVAVLIAGLVGLVVYRRRGIRVSPRRRIRGDDLGMQLLDR